MRLLKRAEMANRFTPIQLISSNSESNDSSLPIWFCYLARKKDLTSPFEFHSIIVNILSLKEVFGMGEDLTKRQRDILNFIHTFSRKKGFQPSMREIGERFGIKSTHGVHRHLQALQKKGYLKRPQGQGRALELVHFMPKKSSVEVPVVARVAAGEPLLAVEHVEETLALDQSLVKGKDNFFLRVKGDSMINAHILDSDFVLVKPQPSADNGDIVVALIEDEATIKRFFQKGKTVELRPENPTLKSLEVKEGDGRFQIIGKVIGVFRQLVK